MLKNEINLNQQDPQPAISKIHNSYKMRNPPVCHGGRALPSAEV